MADRYRQRELPKNRASVMVFALAVAFLIMSPETSIASQGNNSNNGKSPSTKTALNDRRAAVLNRLRNEINSSYGYRDGAPRINLGPCGRFARDFRERWNARFKEKINIVFVMNGDGTNCHHVMVRLPDGTYFDGGNGAITAKALQMLFPGCRLDEMAEFDTKLLDKWSYGLGRSYPICPNYSDDLTDKLIDSHLAELSN